MRILLLLTFLLTYTAVAFGQKAAAPRARRVARAKALAPPPRPQVARAPPRVKVKVEAGRAARATFGRRKLARFRKHANGRKLLLTYPRVGLILPPALKPKTTPRRFGFARDCSWPDALSYLRVPLSSFTLTQTDFAFASPRCTPSGRLLTTRGSTLCVTHPGSNSKTNNPEQPYKEAPPLSANSGRARDNVTAAARLRRRYIARSKYPSAKCGVGSNSITGESCTSRTPSRPLRPRLAARTP